MRWCTGGNEAGGHNRCAGVSRVRAARGGRHSSAVVHSLGRIGGASAQGVWFESQAARALGVSAAELRQQRSRGAALGLDWTDGSAVYPTWQFEASWEGHRVRPALQLFFGGLCDMNPALVARLSVSPHATLGGLSPLGWAAASRPALGLGALAGLIAINFHYSNPSGAAETGRWIRDVTSGPIRPAV